MDSAPYLGLSQGAWADIQDTSTVHSDIVYCTGIAKSLCDLYNLYLVVCINLTRWPVAAIGKGSFMQARACHII